MLNNSLLLVIDHWWAVRALTCNVFNELEEVELSVKKAWIHLCSVLLVVYFLVAIGRGLDTNCLASSALCRAGDTSCWDLCSYRSCLHLQGQFSGHRHLWLSLTTAVHQVPKIGFQATLHFLSYGCSHKQCADAHTVCILGSFSTIWIITGLGVVFFSVMVLYALRSVWKYLCHVCFPPIKPPLCIDLVCFSPCHPLGNGEQMFGFCRWYLLSWYPKSCQSGVIVCAEFQWH